jgi:hypothetical protein
MTTLFLASLILKGVNEVGGDIKINPKNWRENMPQ